MVFHSGDISHCRNTLKALNKLRQRKCLCDVLIKVGTQDIHAHRCVLAAGSDYFMSKLIGQPFIDEKEPIVDLSSVTTDADAVESVIGFLYTGEISIDRDNFETFVKVALYLSVTNVRDILSSFMLETLDLDTCLKYYFVALECLFRNIEENAAVVLKSRFHDCIIFKESSRQLSPEHLQLLMRKCDIFADCSVADILLYVSNWVRAGSTESHESVGCDILDYVYTKVNDRDTSVTSSETATAHTANQDNFSLQLKTDDSKFEKKFEGLLTFLECQKTKNASDLIASFQDAQHTGSEDDTPLISVETVKGHLEKDQFQIKTEVNDSLTENGFENTESYLKTQKLKNDIEVALNKLSSKEVLKIGSVDSAENSINSKSTEVTKYDKNDNNVFQTANQNAQTVKQYECTICKKEYKRKGALEHHIKRFHCSEMDLSDLQILQSEDTETICKYCGKHILYKENMKRHLKTHTTGTGTQHACVVCNKSFKMKEYLKQHMRVVHFKEKTHSCFVCKERFCRNSELRLHMSKHTGEVRHICKDCGVSFKHKRNLITHRRKHNVMKKKSSNMGSGKLLKVESPADINMTKQKSCKMGPGKLLKVDNPADSNMTKWKSCKVGPGKLLKVDNPAGCGTLTLQKLSTKVKELSTVKTESCTPASDKAIENEHNDQLNKIHEMLTELKDRKSNCNICGKVVKPNNLNRHLLTHSSDTPYACTVCQKKFKTKEHLTQHRVSHGERTHPCPVCQKLFLRKNEVIVHMRTHTGEKRYFCHVSSCGKGFCQKSQLTRHIQRHSGVKITPPSVPCPVCKKLIIKSSLRSHMPSHSDEKAFICETCGKQYKSRNALVGHMNLHTANASRPISCKLCIKTFRWDSGLYKHMITTHSGRKSHQCSVCGKQFSGKFYLTRHMAIHSDDKLHCCSTCGRGFNDKGSLNRHFLMHTGEKKYTCKICTKCFTRLENLKGHMSRFHK